MALAAVAAERQRLEGAMQRHVRAKRYEKAAKVRDRLKVVQAQEAAALEGLMRRHVAAQEFEAAAKVRDRLQALQGPRKPSAAPAPQAIALPSTASHSSAPPPVISHPSKSSPPPATPPSTSAATPAAESTKPPRAERRAAKAAEWAEKNARRKREKEVQRLAQQPPPPAAVPLTVVVPGLPCCTPRQVLREAFPKAHGITVLVRSDYDTACLMFRSCKQAQKLAAKGEANVAGRTVRLFMAGSEAGQEAIATALRPATKEEVAEKRAEAKAAKAAEAERERRGRTVLLRALPPTVTVPELRQAVPACKDVDLRTFRHRAKAFLIFPTQEEALAFASQKKIEVADCITPVHMAGPKEPVAGGKRAAPTGPTPDAKRPKA